MQYFFCAGDLSFHQESEHAAVGREGGCDHGGGGMSTVSGAKGVVHIYISEFGECCGKSGFPLLFSLVEAQVFE